MPENTTVAAPSELAAGPAGAVDPSSAAPAAPDPQAELHKRIVAARIEGTKAGVAKGKAELLKQHGFEDDEAFQAAIEAGKAAVAAQTKQTEQAAIEKVKAQAAKKEAEANAEIARLRAIADRAALLEIGREALDDVESVPMFMARHGVVPDAVQNPIVMRDGQPVVLNDKGEVIHEGRAAVVKFLQAEKAKAGNEWMLRPTASGRSRAGAPVTSTTSPTPPQDNGGRPKTSRDLFRDAVKDVIAQAEKG